MPRSVRDETQKLFQDEPLGTVQDIFRAMVLCERRKITHPLVAGVREFFWVPTLLFIHKSFDNPLDFFHQGRKIRAAD